MIETLRMLLMIEAVVAVVMTVLLSSLAGGMEDILGAQASTDGTAGIRFAAGGAFVFAIAAAIASRGARRRRAWSWTLSALLQVIAAIGTGVAVLVADWHPAYLAGFALAAIVMTVLSTASVRTALGQE
jgi:hypothetical protein